MKILVYSDFRHINHSVRPESEILIKLAEMGHGVTVFSPDFDDEGYFNRAGITTYRTHQTAKISLNAIRQLRAELKANHYDIVYATNSKSIPTAAFAAIGYNAKLVCYRGTTRGPNRSDPASYLSLLHPRVDAVICVSEAVKQAVEQKLWRPSVKLAAIFKGHDLAWYTEPPADLSREGIPENSFVAVAAARFRPTKGLDVLLSAASLLADLPRFHLLLVGSGTDEPQYQAIIAASPLRDRIHITGKRSDAPQLIAASQVLVQASTDGEGLPRALLEGLAYGTPAISSTAGGAKEILVEGETGFVVPVNDPNAIAQKLRYLYQNPQQVEQMAHACRSAISKQLSSATTASAYAAFFESLIRPAGKAEQSALFNASAQYRTQHIAPAYAHLQEALASLENSFNASEDVLYAKRNLIKRLPLESCDTVIKSFKPPSGLRAFIYGSARKSKALRSYENACRLRASGISTPEPISVIEYRKSFRLKESFYITAHFDHHFTMEPVLQAIATAGVNDQSPEIVGQRNILKSFVKFTFDMHSAGAVHGDHNPNNTLVRKQQDGYAFAVIDLNRMRFGSPSFGKRMTDFSRLSDDQGVLKIIAETYAHYAGLSANTCYDTLRRATQRRLRTQRWKRSLKKLRASRASQ